MLLPAPVPVPVLAAPLQRRKRLDPRLGPKVRGVYKGRIATLDPAKVRQLAAEGLGGTAIAAQLGISSRTTVYRALGAA